MENPKKIRYELEHFYPGFERQKFFDLFVDPEAWTKSKFLPEIRILKPGKSLAHGLGAVRLVLSGRMEIKEDIVGFRSPSYFSYTSRNGSLPVNDFGGELFLEEKDGGVFARYKGSFNPRFFGTGWLFKFVFQSAQKSAFRNLGKAYRDFYP